MKKIMIKRGMVCFFIVVICLVSCTTLQNPHVILGDGTADGFTKIETEGFIFEWKVISNTNLKVKLSAPTTGWVAVGFDPSTGMKGANIIIGYVNAGGVEIVDAYAHKLTNYDSDINLGGQDNISNKTGIESGGRTLLEFTIPLNSGDAQDKVLTKGATHTLLLAYGDSDDRLKQHVKRTQLNFKL